jgi:RimJ/RimL family protein N-acetyltransferase
MRPRGLATAKTVPFHLDVYKRLDRLGTWAAESADNGEFLGWFCFRPDPGGDITNIELGYRLSRSTWNKGYATEGSRALITMGFTTLGVQRVHGHTMTVNAASRRVMENCGLTLVHTVPYDGPDADLIDGAEHGEVEYALTKPEWLARTATTIASSRAARQRRRRGPSAGSSCPQALGARTVPSFGGPPSW